MSDLPEPISREDKLLHNIAVGEPNIEDMVPMSREEEYLKYIATHGSGGGDISGTVEINQGGTGATTAEGARENLGLLKMYTLYDSGLGGTNGTITLNDNCENYEYLEIFYGGEAYGLTSAKVPIANYCEEVALTVCNTKDDGSVNLKCVNLLLQLNIISFQMPSNIKFENNQSPTVANQNLIEVYRVVGYKY